MLMHLYRVSNPHSLPCMYNLPSAQTHLSKYSNNLVHLLRNKEATEAKRQQTGSQTPEPRQIAFILLTRDPYVHPPETGNDIHWQHDGTQDREFAENVGGLLLALVHADVDLS
jgi:hypothetical protein